MFSLHVVDSVSIPIFYGQPAVIPEGVARNKILSTTGYGLKPKRLISDKIKPMLMLESSSELLVAIIDTVVVHRGGRG